MYDASGRIILSDKGLSNFGPFFTIKSVILGFAENMHFMGYIQYKCFRKEIPVPGMCVCSAPGFRIMLGLSPEKGT